MSFLYRLKRLVPATWLSTYHYALARLADVWYGHPSRQLIVIGVTGTNGKTTTTYLTAKALESAEAPAGCTTTAILKIGPKEWLNDTKMTMPGRFFLQRMLRQMVKAGCRYAVIETSSQGLIQSRHVGIAYDLAIFTNLTPEHIEAHGGFEEYKKAKQILFEHLATQPPKILDGKEVPRVAILNADSPFAEFYAATPGLKDVRWFGIDDKRGLTAEQIELSATGSRFSVEGYSLGLHLPGRYNIENALAALAVAKALDVSLPAAVARLSAITRVAGRFERIEEGQPWTVIVDYAPEPESLRQVYAVIAGFPHKRLIHVLGSAGGGRDVSRRPILGRLAGEQADVVIVTNEDPYDENPQMIIDQVAAGALEAGKTEGETVFRILDRRAAIDWAMQLAQAGDIVLLTGKGAETHICMANGKKLPWDEFEAARTAIRRARISHV